MLTIPQKYMLGMLFLDVIPNLSKNETIIPEIK